MEEEKRLTKKERREAKKQAKFAAVEQSKRQAGLKKLAFAATLVVVLAALIFHWWNSRVPVPSEYSNFQPGVVSALDQVKGNPEASVIITKYSDFQCPACAYYASMLQQAVEQSAGQVALVYRHFPLKQIHFKAELAAQATEAAGKQGKFWEMHDLIFERQDDWAQSGRTKQLFQEYAQQLGLDENQFKQDLNSQDVKARVKGHYLHGLELGILSTPTLYLNETKIENPASLDELQALISALLPPQEATPSASPEL